MGRRPLKVVVEMSLVLVAVKLTAVNPSTAANFHLFGLSLPHQVKSPVASSIHLAVSTADDFYAIHKCQCCVKVMADKVHHRAQSAAFEVESNSKSSASDGPSIHSSQSMRLNDSTFYDANHVGHVALEGTCPSGLMSTACELNLKSLEIERDIAMTTGYSALVICDGDHVRSCCWGALCTEIESRKVVRGDSASLARCPFQACLVPASVAVPSLHAAAETLAVLHFLPEVPPTLAFGVATVTDRCCWASSTVNQPPTPCRPRRH